MSIASDETLQKAVDAIVKEADPAQIILFGSRARGDAKPDSDYDLLVVVEGAFGAHRSRYREMAKLCRALARLPLPEDILLFTREEVEYWRDSLNHVVGRALREGKVLYARQ